MLAQLDVSGLAYPLAGAASIAILLLALLGRYRLPLGVSEAWFVGALSGALLLSQATLRGATEGDRRCGIMPSQRGSPVCK